jgi:hypothetical protein
MVDLYDYSKLWYYMEWRVDMWHLVQRGSKLHHKPNKHIPPHHFTPVARENKKVYKVWINNKWSDSKSNHIVILLSIFPGKWEGVWRKGHVQPTVW